MVVGSPACRIDRRAALYPSTAEFCPHVHRHRLLFRQSSYVGTTDLVDTTQYYDSQATEQVVSSFPYIIRSEAMQERIRLTLDTTWINGTVSASSIGETNIFTLTVTSNQPQDAYDIFKRRD